MTDGKKIKFVAELSINHLGMINICKAMIKSAKESGADYIKLKIKDVSNYYDKNSNKKWRDYDFIKYRQSLEIPKENFEEINQFCQEIGIEWFSTVHDKKGLDFIKKFNPPFFKVASMDSDNKEFVQEVVNLCKETNTPLIISIGGKDNAFLESLLSFIKSSDIECYILHTVSIYPTPLGQSNINYIDHLIQTCKSDKIKIGYSGHEEGYAATILATSKDIDMVERHFALSKDLQIHHIKAALTPKEFSDMTNLVAEINSESAKSNQSFNSEELNFLKNKEYN